MKLNKELEYIGVPLNEKSEFVHGETNYKSWKPFLRQCFIGSGLWTAYFSVGISLGTPTVYVPQVRRAANSTDAVSMEMASWLSSIFGYSSIPFVFLLAAMMSKCGRRQSNILVALSMLVVSTGYYLTASPLHLLITNVIQGIANAATFTVSILSMVEYVSPRNRGVMLAIKTAVVFWAIWIANAIGTYTDWRFVCIPSYINSFYALTVFFWPESPTWLASKGRFEECRKVHRWLRGCDDTSERELKKLIDSQIVERKRQMDKKDSLSDVLKDKAFYMPVLLSIVMICVHLLSGKQICMMYALDILVKITKSESEAYSGMLLLDGVTVACMYMGCAVSRVISRRALLFVFGSLAALFLFLLSLYLYLVHLTLIAHNNYISMSLLVGFSIAISAGPILLAISLYGELIPTRYKGTSVIVISIFFFTLQATLFKVSPYILYYLDIHGMFLICGISVSIGLSILYKYLPETKDKTLQEIEEYFKSQ